MICYVTQLQEMNTLIINKECFLNNNKHIQIIKYNTLYNV